MKQYDKLCALCSHSTYIFPADECYCDIKGPVDEYGHCGKFNFDLLKHKPASPLMPELETE